MKIETVNVRVNRNGDGPHEVFITKVDPNINFAMYLPHEMVADLEPGQYTLELTRVADSADNG